MATLRDVAERVGVHPSTVSRALDPASANLVNVETRARVIAAAEELGFRVDPVASGLRRGRTSTMGVVVADFGNPFIASAIRGIENTFESHGFMTFITESQDDPERTSRILGHLLARKVEAIITFASRAGDEAEIKRISEQMPIVLAVRGLPGSDLATVVSDDEGGGWISADHLIGLGHRVLAQLPGPRDVSTFRLREDGFNARAAAANASVIPSQEAAAVPTVSEGRRLMRNLLAGTKRRPTGVFAHNDLMALGAIQAMRDAGLECPADISIIGYNDAPLTDFTDPPLSTVSLPGYDLGQQAARLAMAMIAGTAGEDRYISLPPTLVPRRSTAPYPRHR
jgi:LacI family transcriptional regulator